MSYRDDKGHFDLKLNCKTADDVQLKFRIARLKLHIRDELSPLQLANRNLLGVLYFYLGEYYESYDQFEWILNKDPENLNAFRNIIWVCKTIMDSKRASDYASKLDTILKNEPDQRVWARCTAEHAYAHASETYSGTNELRRFYLSNELYDRCLESTTGLIKSADEDFRRETAEWLLIKIWNYKKVFNRNHVQDRSKNKNECSYTEILKTIFEIQDLVPNDACLQSLSWGYLGYFFSDVREFPVPEVVFERNMNAYFNNPEKCFQRALEIQEGVEVLQLYTGWLNEGRRFDEGIQKLNRCLELRPTNLAEINYFSYSERGKLLLRKCTSDLENIGPTENWKGNIQQAISDLEFAASVNPTSHVYGYLLSAYCLVYTGTGEDEMKIKCLCSYRKGLNCLDGKTDRILHSKHAMCLKKLQEHDTALCVMQRSIESQDAQTTFVKDIKNLMDWKIERYNKDPDEQIIREMAFWFHDVAFTKYNRESFKRLFEDFLNRYSNSVNLLSKFVGELYLKHDFEFNQFTIECLEHVGTDKTLNYLTILKQISVSVTPMPFRKGIDLRPRNTAGFEYDFYVISSPKDTEWVHFSLLSNLENYWEYKGFVDDRDADIGQSIFTNITNAIDKCFKFILVITPNFLESDMCNHVTEAAFLKALGEKKKRGSVIPIVKDDAIIPDFLKTIKHLHVCDQPIKHTMLESIVKALDKE